MHEHFHLQWRIDGHDRVSHSKLRRCTIYNVEGRLDDWTLAVDRSAIKRDTKDIVESKLDCLQRGQIGVAIEGSVSFIFGLVEQADELFDVRFVEDSTRLPNH